ncbi:MAG: hypothetical protein KF701_04645 [Anaerolineales bacterium]|nr:MAG: hypothetical protein KF701_04645 [Anaerolineales bacterium]
MARGRYLGRIPLRTLPPELAERYLLEWHPRRLALEPGSFPQLSSAAIFGNALPLEVEIGAGTGEFALSLAAGDPAANVLALELSNRSARWAAWLAAEAGLPNLKVLRADFKLLGPLLPAAGWRRAYLHFPDPQHKPADAKRILFNQSFLDGMAQALQPGGELSVVSDAPGFFLQMLELAEGDGRFAKMHPERYLEGFEPEVKSRFQQIWERKGRTPRQFVLKRV